MSIAVAEESVSIEVPEGAIGADFRIPERPAGLVMFAHGSGSSRFSARNRVVARHLESHDFGTLLIDLLIPEEDTIDKDTGEYRFDIERLSGRVILAMDWVERRAELRSLPLGLFGASTGAAAVLVAAAERPAAVAAVVSRGGRPDLAREALPNVKAPTLLIVGGHDTDVIAMNRSAMGRMATRVALEIVPAASHLFEEPGALEKVSRLSALWFHRYLDQKESR